MKKFWFCLVVLMLVGGLGCDDSTIKPGVQVMYWQELDNGIESIPSEKIQYSIQEVRKLSSGPLRNRSKKSIPSGPITNGAMYFLQIGSTDLTDNLKKYIQRAITADNDVEYWLDNDCRFPHIYSEYQGIMFVYVENSSEVFVDVSELKNWLEKKIQN